MCTIKSNVLIRNIKGFDADVNSDEESNGNDGADIFCRILA